MQEHSDIDVGELLQILKRRRWLILFTTAAVIAAGVALSALQTPEYSSRATVLIAEDVRRSIDDDAGSQFSSPDLLNRALTNEIAFAKGDAVRTTVKRRVGSIPKVSITAVPDTDALAFVVRNPSARRARQLANVYAITYLTERRKSRTQDYLKTAKALRAQVSSLRKVRRRLKPNDPQIPSIQASLATFQNSLADLRASGDLSRAGGSILRQATKADAPASPNVVLNLLVAIVLGLVAGLLAAVLRDRLDDSILSKDDLDRASGGRPVLALVPRVREWSNPRRGYVVSFDRPQAPASEAYRLLRSSLQILDRVSERSVRLLAVTSPSAGDGKTATTANLAVALARAGHRVVIVDLDLRRPRIESFFGVDNNVGFISVVLGDELQACLHDIEEQPGLRILAAGPLVPNPSEVLSLARTGEILRAVADQADYVLVDCPPVLPVPDAVSITQNVDGVLMVASARRGKRRSFARAVELLEQANAPIVGSVLNGVRTGVTDEYDYTYAYPYDAGSRLPRPFAAVRHRLRRGDPAGARGTVAALAPDAAERLVRGETAGRTVEPDEGARANGAGVSDASRHDTKR